MQTSEWVLLLEGVCRVRIHSLLAADCTPGKQYLLAHVTQLEAAATPLSQLPQPPSQPLQQQVQPKEEDAETRQLASQLRAATAILLKKLM